MDISVYLGRAGTGKTEACFEHIKELIEQHPGEPIILLVPEPATYVTERRLAEFMPEQGFTTVRVVGFNRLAYQVFQSLGKVRNTGLSDIGQKLLLRLVMKRQAGSLELLGQVARQPHFADIVQQLLTECNSFKVDGDSLREGAKGVESIVLQRKLNELAHLMDSYKALASETIGDTQDQMSELIEDLPLSPLLSEGHVIVDGFHWFTPLQMELVYTLADLAKDMIITLTLPPELAKLGVPPEKLRLFGRPYSILTDLLQTYGSKLTIRQFTEAQRFENPVISALESGYFNTKMKPNSKDETLPFIVAYNREREADAVCRKLLEEMKNPERRWRHMAIMLRESETYGDILEKALKRYEIPYFSDRTRPMVSHPLGEFVLGLLDVVHRNFNHDALFRLLKTDFWSLSRQEIDELENYCLEFGIRDFMWLKEHWDYMRYNRFSSEAESIDELQQSVELDAVDTLQQFVDTKTIDAQGLIGTDAIDAPQGLADAGLADVTKRPSNNREPLAGEVERCERVNACRALIMKELRPLWEFSKTAHTGHEWCEALYKVLLAVGVPQRLYEWTEGAREAGATDEAAAHEQMYKQVVSLFDEIMKLNLPDELKLDEIELLIKEGIEDVTYSLVPPSLDHVIVTTIERGYTREHDIVFLMGLNDGVFPQHMGDEGLLNDSERVALKAAGVTLAEGALVRAFNENFLLYLACTRARQTLYISCARSSEGDEDEGGALEPSLALKRWQQLGYVGAGENVPLTIPSEEGDEAIWPYLWRPTQSLSLLASQMAPLSHGEDLGPVWRSVYEWSRQSEYNDTLRIATRGSLDSNEVPRVERSIVEALLFRHDALSGSVTRIERYQKCPFSFYAQYGLRLEERPIKQFGAPEIGTFLHESLRVLGQRLLREQKQWRDLPQLDEAALCKAVVDEIAADVKLGEEGNIYEIVLRQRLEDTLRRTVARLSDWSQKSAFDTKYLEQNFGGGAQSWPPVMIPLGGANHIRLQGQLDRVDEWSDGNHTYGLVVDYKTGNIKVTASEIYYGLKLQLVTYLLALEKAQRTNGLVPAALVYSFVQNPRITTSHLVTDVTAPSLVAEKGEVRNTGYYTDDLDILVKMDETLESVKGKKTPYVPIRISSKGTIYASDMYLTKSAAQFNVLTDYAQDVMSRAGSHMLEGHFPISPYNYNDAIPCNYCSYKALCRFENTRNSYRYITKLSEEEALDKMEKGDDVYEVDARTTTGD
ncbi:MAG: PD-(D/E)XK nuclease family protein [Veillonella caviae]|nr:PD-(D/E)XK nuclease family protein [Veillonella caviae]